MKTIKVLLVGDGDTGKTTFVKDNREGVFDRRYNATMGVEVHPLKFHTNKGPIVFNLWDTAGQEKFGGLRYGYYIQGQAAIVFFDHSSKLTLTNTLKWAQDVKRVCPNIPIVLVGNKSDILKYEPDEDHKKQFHSYHSMSVMTQANYGAAFLTLAKYFLGEDTVFKEDP